MKTSVTPVILCGGSGTRLWPLSRSGYPKQFLVLSGTTSLFQQALERTNALSSDDIEIGQTLVVTNEEHRFLALDQLRELKNVSATLLLEPVDYAVMEHCPGSQFPITMLALDAGWSDLGAWDVGRVCTDQSVDTLQRLALELVDDVAATAGAKGNAAFAERCKALSAKMFSTEAAVRQIVAALKK